MGVLIDTSSEKVQDLGVVFVAPSMRLKPCFTRTCTLENAKSIGQFLCNLLTVVRIR